MPNDESAARAAGRRRPKKAFLSKPELVFVLALVLIAFSLVLPTITYIRQRFMLDVADSDLDVLQDACQRFYAEYGVWPTAYPGEVGDVRYGKLLPNYEVMNALRAVDGQGNDGHSVNPRRVVFLDVRRAGNRTSGLNERGDFVDPWGIQYQIVLDSDLNNVCDVKDSIYNRVPNHGMIAWSCGPDRKSETSDDILFWDWSPAINSSRGY